MHFKQRCNKALRFSLYISIIFALNPEVRFIVILGVSMLWDTWGTQVLLWLSYVLCHLHSLGMSSHVNFEHFFQHMENFESHAVEL